MFYCYKIGDLEALLFSTLTKLVVQDFKSNNGGCQGIRVDEGIDCDVEVDLEQLLENEEATESVSH